MHSDPRAGSGPNSVGPENDLDPTVSIVVATHGGDEWDALARTRAIPSADAQGVPVHHVHLPEGTLAQARNAALALVETEWVIHLDADDELAPDYVERMLEGTADLRVPMICQVRPGRQVGPLWQPRVAGHHHACTVHCIREGNWLPVGTMARVETIYLVGGWREWPCYEDWDLWLRCITHEGASAELMDRAIYRAHYRGDSRNHGMHVLDRNKVHHDILAANT